MVTPDHTRTHACNWGGGSDSPKIEYPPATPPTPPPPQEFLPSRALFDLEIPPFFPKKYEQFSYQKVLFANKFPMFPQILSIFAYIWPKIVKFCLFLTIFDQNLLQSAHFMQNDSTPKICLNAPLPNPTPSLRTHRPPPFM